MPTAVLRVPWQDPVTTLASIAEDPYALAFLSDGSTSGRWSYVTKSPVATFASVDEARAGLSKVDPDDRDLPPFWGGLAGLACYEWSAALEAVCPQVRTPSWPDLSIGLYTRLLAFDHVANCVLAIGCDETSSGARRAAQEAAGWLDAPQRSPSRIRSSVWPDDRPRPYPADVAQVVDAIVEGELIQANIARTWAGRLAAGRPVDVLRHLAKSSPAPFGGYFRLPGLALVSNSPERFIKVTADGYAETKPIKGTRPRGKSEAEDRAFASELLSSVKDRAENLMIVDLMRNDLSQLCRIGSVGVDSYCALESFANVHHLVSTVHGHLRDDVDALDLFARAFPPGSVTGCPKLQAMKVIARHERPRGPYCGSMFWFGFDGAFDSNVLIRSLAFEEDEFGWRFETRAGAGITADSDPNAENAEAEAKIAAIYKALTWT